MMMRTLSHYRHLTRVLTCPRPSPRVNLQSSRMVRYLAQNEAVNVDLELFDSYKVKMCYIKVTGKGYRVDGGGQDRDMGWR